MPLPPVNPNGRTHVTSVELEVPNVSPVPQQGNGARSLRGKAASSRASSVSRFSTTNQAEIDDVGMLYESEVLASVFGELPMGCVLITGDGIVKGFSPAARRMFLYEGWEVLGENVSMLMDDTTAARHDYYVNRVKQRIDRTIMSTTFLTKSPSSSSVKIQIGNGPVREEDTITLAKVPYLRREKQIEVNEVISKVALFGGAAREVHGVDKDGGFFPMELKLSALLVHGELHFMGFCTDIRHTVHFQQLSVKQEDLLTSMMNQQTLNRLLNGERLISDTFQSTSVGFCDMVGFTPKTKALKDHKMIQLLNEIFGLFDRAVEKSRVVEKVKTIGDCYMMVCGVPTPVLDHAEHMVNVAMAFIDSIDLYNTTLQDGGDIIAVLYTKGERKRMGLSENPKRRMKGEGWRASVIPVALRIGIHSGPLIGGIMSRMKGLYDVIGETVNVASRLESTGVPNSIHISEATYNLLSKEMQDQFAQREVEVELKGIGKTKSFLLNRDEQKDKGRQESSMFALPDTLTEPASHMTVTDASTPPENE